MFNSFTKVILIAAAVVVLVILLSRIPQNVKTNSSSACLEKKQVRTLVSEIKNLTQQSEQDQNPVYSLIHLTGALCKIQLLQMFGPRIEKMYNLNINKAKLNLKKIQTAKIQEIQNTEYKNKSVFPDGTNFYE